MSRLKIRIDNNCYDSALTSTSPSSEQVYHNTKWQIMSKCACGLILIHMERGHNVQTASIADEIMINTPQQIINSSYNHYNGVRAKSHCTLQEHYANSHAGIMGLVGSG